MVTDISQPNCDSFLFKVTLLWLTALHALLQGDGENKPEAEETIKKDLRSRGLCLIPVESTLHVANDNGADLWSPAMVINNVS